MTLSPEQWGTAQDAAPPSPIAFRRRLKDLLTDALSRVGACEPTDSSEATAFVEETLDSASAYIFDTLHPPAERRAEMDEQRRHARTVMREKGVDELAMRMDERVMRLGQAVADPRLALPAIQRIGVALVVASLLDLVDRTTSGTWAGEYATVSSLEERDPRVGAVMAVIAQLQTTPEIRRVS